MARIKFDKNMDKYRILFEDGSHGWFSQIAVEDLFPNRDWDTVKNNSQWFFI